LVLNKQLRGLQPTASWSAGGGLKPTLPTGLPDHPHANAGCERFRPNSASSITVFGMPTDVILAELALETFFPADVASAE